MASVTIEGQTLTLSGDATISWAEALHQSLTTALPRVSDALVINVAALEFLDCAGAQVLIAFRRTVGTERVRITGWSADVAEYLRLVGLAPELDCAGTP